MHQELSQLTDEQLIAKYRQSGLKLAVGELFKRYSLMCFAVCNKYLKDEQAAEDAAMSVFEKLFKDLKNHEIQNFKSWDAVEYQEFNKNFTGNINTLFPYNPQQTASANQYSPRAWRNLYSARNTLKSMDELKNDVFKQNINAFINSTKIMK